MNIKLGFTGTRFPPSEAQKITLGRLLSTFVDVSEAHHGDCVGADSLFHELVKMYHWPSWKLIIHPPLILSKEDEKWWAKNAGADEVRKPLRHLARNRVIVDETDRLIAVPLDDSIQVRGGTWYTVQYAHKLGKVVHVIWPNGHVGAL